MEALTLDLGFYPREDLPLCSFFCDPQLPSPIPPPLVRRCTKGGEWEGREATPLSRNGEEPEQNLQATAQGPEPRVLRAELPNPEMRGPTALTSVIAFQFKNGVLCLNFWREKER